MQVADHVNIGWGAGIHQFCRLGRHCMVSACSKLVQDVPPFMLADGSPAEVRAINKIGLERSDFSSEQIESIRSIFKVLYRRDLNRSQAVEHLEALAKENENLLLNEILDFLKIPGRGLA